MQNYFQSLSEVDIETINKEHLVNVSGISLDKGIPHHKRIDFLLDKIKNPYCFCVGDMCVKLEFSNKAPPLQDVMTDFLIRKKSGL